MQARLVGERFSGEHIDVVYASPLLRALHTGEQIARHHGSRRLWFRPAHTAVNVLRARDHVRALETINDVHHLRTYEGHVVSW